MRGDEKMAIEGEGFPKICGSCIESHWEEMAMGFEDAWCGKYDLPCYEAVKKCDRIPCLTCIKCPRHME